MKMRIETIIKKLKAQYDSVGKPNHDIMKVVHKGKYGFFNIKGEQIIPFFYDWSSSFVRIKLYRKTYIGAYIIKGEYKTIIDVERNHIITPMKSDTMYYIINDKLWVKGKDGYNLISRRGKKLLSNNYDLIVNDRFRQPRNVYLVEKNGKYGAIYISHNNQESGILPLAFKNLSFWYAPTLGIFIKATINGKENGLYRLDGSMAVPCKYQEFDFLTPFRKGFILASDSREYTLYDGDLFIPLATSPLPIDARYAFYWKEKSYYSIHTVTQELLINKNGKMVARVSKKEYISYFHYLMNLQRDTFKFKSLNELLKYCQKIKNGKLKLTSSVKRDLAVYGYYFLEEELHKYATMHQFEYVRFTLHDLLLEKRHSLGTCHIYGRVISLNLNVLFNSEEVIRLVILHELVHLRNASHNRYFFRTLNELYGSDTRTIHCPSYSILDTVDSISIVKRKTRELFAMAEKKGLHCPSDIINEPSIIYAKNNSSEEYLVAALEK